MAPERRIRALHDRAGRFVAPFKRARMTWTKPTYHGMLNCPASSPGRQGRSAGPCAT